MVELFASGTRERPSPPLVLGTRWPSSPPAPIRHRMESPHTSVGSAVCTLGTAPLPLGGFDSIVEPHRLQTKRPPLPHLESTGVSRSPAFISAEAHLNQLWFRPWSRRLGLFIHAQLIVSRTHRCRGHALMSSFR